MAWQLWRSLEVFSGPEVFGVTHPTASAYTLIMAVYLAKLAVGSDRARKRNAPEPRAGGRTKAGPNKKKGKTRNDCRIEDVGVQAEPSALFPLNSHMTWDLFVGAFGSFS
jgi:hypothetical protein